MNLLEIYPKGDFHTGAAIQLRDLARGLAARGHRVTVVTRASERWAAEGSCRRLHAPRVLPTDRLDPVGAARLAGVLRREGIEVVHAHKGGGRTLTLLARGLGPRPPLVVNRGVSFPMAPVSRWVDGSRAVARIVAVCQAIKDDLVRQGLPAAKIDVVYSGTDTDWFDPARASGGPGSRQELGLHPDTPLVTQIGVREPKGNDDLLRAFARIRAARPDARLLLVGARPEKRAPLEALARAGGLGDAVTIWGYRDDVPDVLAASQVSVDASYEGLGITGDASASPWPWRRRWWRPGRWATRSSSATRRTGSSSRPGTPTRWRRPCSGFSRDPAWARSLGQAGRARVVAGFSTRAKVERLERLYARVARARSGQS